jgi:flagellar protein FliS
MFGSAQNGAKAYATVGMETGVIAANPHKLIVMLFEGAQIALTTASQQMTAGNIAAKGQAISKAIMIIDNGLRASLDKTVGGDIAIKLDSLYEYMSNQLLNANLKNDPALVEEVQGLLEDIKGAWIAITPSDQNMQNLTPSSSSIQQNGTAVYDALTPRTSTLMKA